MKQTHILQNLVDDHEWPASKNDSINKINENVLEPSPVHSKSYKSVDTSSDTALTVLYPDKFLNSSDIPGVTPHNWNLKFETPIMLLRNLNTPWL
ncbi:hypothetical protein NPIL_53741 [Nephila pilipes]|uniref:DNA helicase Pif1-like 2B domain-containing protein n=1 Tax=Nephila pilipes TaxID=299642 RepID=A0A8X6PD69_NEPPI|nr:hypothetical protein NPIL_53741 [Nephila pilipes]